MGTVAVIVARRNELVGQHGKHARVAAVAFVVVARADQLLVAVAAVERGAWLALAVPARDLLVTQLAVLGAVAVGAGAVGKARMLGRDAAVDDADDDVLALHAWHVPQPFGFGDAQEVGRRGGGELAQFVAHHGGHTGCGGQLGGLRLAQFGREAVVGVDVAVGLARATDGGQRGVVLLRQMVGVGGHRRRVRVDLPAFLRLRGGKSGDAAVVGQRGGVGHLHDVHAARLGCGACLGRGRVLVSARGAPRQGLFGERLSRHFLRRRLDGGARCRRLVLCNFTAAAAAGGQQQGGARGEQPAGEALFQFHGGLDLGGRRVAARQWGSWHLAHGLGSQSREGVIFVALATRGQWGNTCFAPVR